MELRVLWYMHLEASEIEAIIRLHEVSETAARDKRDYAIAAMHKQKIESWLNLKGKELKVVEESK